MCAVGGDGSGRYPPVLWTRGAGCQELASLLSDPEPVRVVGDLTETCYRHRAQLLVSRRLTASDLVSLAVPVDFDSSEVRAVVAAVAGGPHSSLAARIAHRLGQSMGLPALMACAYRDEDGSAQALSTIERLFPEVPHLEYRLVETVDAAGLFAQIPEQSLLVLGAPGGNWLQRSFFGQGARLRHSAPAGAVVVKRAPDRAFQMMGEPVFVGPLREAGDILRIHTESVLAVVDQAKLVGLVRRDVLGSADPGRVVSDLMEEPVSVSLDAPADEVLALREVFGTAPVPIVDGDGRLVGGAVAGG